MVHIPIDQTDNDPLSLTMDYTHFLPIQTIITLFCLSILIFVTFNKNICTVNCHMHTHNNKHFHNKLFHMLAVLYVSPFWLGIILNDSCIKCSKSDACYIFVLWMKMLKSTCILYGILSNIIMRKLLHIKEYLNTIKSRQNVLKIININPRHIVKHLIVCNIVINCKNMHRIYMIMIIYKMYRLVQKVTCIKALQILTSRRCHPNSLCNIDALGPYAQCYHITGINIRLITALIRINSYFRLQISVFQNVTCFYNLDFGKTRSSNVPIRFIHFNNRFANLILDMTDQPKTESPKYTRKNGWCDTWRFFIPACKLKFQILRQAIVCRYKIISYIDTLIIQSSCIKRSISTSSLKSVKKSHTQGTHTTYFLRENHDHEYVNTIDLYVTPGYHHG